MEVTVTSSLAAVPSFISDTADRMLSGFCRLTPGACTENCLGEAGTHGVRTAPGLSCGAGSGLAGIAKMADGAASPKPASTSVITRVNIILIFILTSHSPPDGGLGVGSQNPSTIASSN